MSRTGAENADITRMAAATGELTAGQRDRPSVPPIFVFYMMFGLSAFGVKTRVIFTIVSIMAAVGSFIWIYWIQNKYIKNTFGGIKGLKAERLDRAESLFKEHLGVEKMKDYELLDVLVIRELKEHESKSFPFVNVIKQLVVAIFITGLLSYSFNQLAAGNKELAYSLLFLYIFILGTLVIVGLFAYGLQEFTKTYKLRQISKLIVQIQLRKTIAFRNVGENESSL